MTATLPGAALPMEVPTASTSKFSPSYRDRWLHPVAWWSWAAGVAVAATVTTNPLLLIGLMVATGVVVDCRKPVAPWARSFAFFVKLALVILAIRVLAQVLIGAPGGTVEVAALPGLALPEWLAGVRLGGDVMLEPLLAALYDGLRLAAIVVAVGAASSLASPARLLKSVPAAVYEVGVSIVVATTFLPQLVSDVARVRGNRRLRGRRESGIRGFGAAAMPVLHGAMDRSITLAAAMDSRGYGRTSYRSTRERRLSTFTLIIGLLLATLGVYGLLGTGSATWWGPVLVITGFVCTSASLVISGRRSVRTRYRPNVWHTSDVLTALTGITVAALFTVAGLIHPDVMATPTSPPAWPTLSIAAIAGVLVAALPAIITPRPPRIAARDHRSVR
jgi:energy-coupling factor transport system permease protein